jgi:catechol 2,3-dioxygenase-like lactoylglutathione lyase family enzyme
LQYGVHAGRLHDEMPARQMTWLQEISTMAVETRPPVWIGHVTLKTRTLDESETFMKQIGMRGIFRGDQVAVLELRGGTHLVLMADESAEGGAGFDLMVEDIDSTYAQFKAAGFVVSGMREGSIHNSFTVTEPGGNDIVVNSTHVPDHAAVWRAWIAMNAHE